MPQSLSFPQEVRFCEGFYERSGITKASKKLLANEHSNIVNILIGQDNYKLVTQQTCKDNEQHVESFYKMVNIQAQREISHIKSKIDSYRITAQSGTRLWLSKYSLKRCSLDDWRRYHEKMLGCSVITESNISNCIIHTDIHKSFGNIDKEQLKGNNFFKLKCKDFYTWKVEVELLCKEIAEELELLEMVRRRIKNAWRLLILPEAITKECIKLRGKNADTELVADLPEYELKKEMELVKEVRANLRSILIHKIDEQLAIDKAAKHRIEYDWCDKTVTYYTEAKTSNLTIHPNTLMFKPGFVKFGEQTLLSNLEFFSKGNVAKVKTVRQASADLRATFEAMLMNNGRNLRVQADRTNKALALAVTQTSQLITELEEQLRHLLQSLAEIELIMKHLQDSLTKSDRLMKLKLNKLYKQNMGILYINNEKDEPHLSLIYEVKVIHGSVTSLLIQLKNGDNTRRNLMARRIDLEKAITAKKKSLNIDRERCGMIRSHYPSASELAGL